MVVTRNLVGRNQGAHCLALRSSPKRWSDPRDLLYSMGPAVNYAVWCIAKMGWSRPVWIFLTTTPYSWHLDLWSKSQTCLVILKWHMGTPMSNRTCCSHRLYLGKRGIGGIKETYHSFYFGMAQDNPLFVQRLQINLEEAMPHHKASIAKAGNSMLRTWYDSTRYMLFLWNLQQ